jgi:hypothetical protein
MKQFFATLILATLSISIYGAYAGTLTCSITTAAACTGTVVFRMSSSANAHAELPGQSTTNYASNVVCCSGVTGLSNVCTGTQATVVALKAATNSHVQQNSLGTYTNNACLSVPTGGSVTVFYQATNCTGYDTTVASIVSSDNSHIGNTTAYTTKICATASAAGVTQSLSFAISTTTVYLGTLSSATTNYGSSTNTNGSATEVQAHTLTVNTNATTGYAITVQGQTLTATQNSAWIITPLASNTVPSVSSEQFGIRMSAGGGTGSVNSPYAASGFAYSATATTSSQVAGNTVGDSATTTYSVRYMTNISLLTDPGSYSGSFVYVATANF